MNLWAWQFKKAETTGIGAQIAALERGSQVEEKPGREHEMKDYASKGVEEQVETGTALV